MSGGQVERRGRPDRCLDDIEGPDRYIGGNLTRSDADTMTGAGGVVLVRSRGTLMLVMMDGGGWTLRPGLHDAPDAPGGECLKREPDHREA